MKMKTMDLRGKKSAEVAKMLDERIVDVFSTDRFRKWLNVQVQFHNYSFHNTMLIMLQFPNAVQVAGYRAWQKLGRYVRKGEQGIKIFAPLIKKVKKKIKEEDPLTGETREKVKNNKVLKGFRLVTVFDVSQTDGKPLPEIASTLSGDNEVAEHILGGLETYADQIGIKVEYIDGLVNIRGSYNYEKRLITIEKAPQKQMAKTMIHEMAHALSTEQIEDRIPSEIIAEAVAYMVSQHYGMDTSSYSFEYMASYTKQLKDDVRLNMFKKLAGVIQSTSKNLIDAIDTQNKNLEVA